MGAAVSHEAPTGVQDGSFSGPPRATLGRRPAHGNNPMLVAATAAEAPTLVPPRHFDLGAPRDHPPPPVVYQAPVQTRAIVGNVVNLKKSTLKLAQSSQDPFVYLVEFEFFAKVDGFITVYYAAIQDVDPSASSAISGIEKVSFSGLHERRPSKTMFSTGANQRYMQKADKGLDVRKYSATDLFYKEGSKRFPLVIRLEAVFPDDSPTPPELRVKTQTTFATLVPGSGGGYTCRVLHQDVLVGGTIYTMQELYGIAGEVKASRASAAMTNGNDGSAINVSANAGQNYAIEKGHECVICLTESCTTAVVPCNHLCLCDDCGEKLCSDSNFERRRCPICRSPLTSLLRIIGNRTTRLAVESSEHGPVVVSPSGRTELSGVAASYRTPECAESPGTSSTGAVVDQGKPSEGLEHLSASRAEASSSTSLSQGAEFRDESASQRHSADGIIASVLEQGP